MAVASGFEQLVKAHRDDVLAVCLAIVRDAAQESLASPSRREHAHGDAPGKHSQPYDRHRHATGAESPPYLATNLEARGSA